MPQISPINWLTTLTLIFLTMILLSNAFTPLNNNGTENIGSNSNQINTSW